MTESGKNLDSDLEEFKGRLEGEPVSSFLGMRLLELTPSYSKVTMKMRPEYLTFNGYVFGGIIMSVADQAFACAANAAGRTSIATQFNTHFMSGPAPDDELIAECRVVRRGRRVDICEISVSNQGGKLIATATGTAIPLT